MSKKDADRLDVGQRGDGIKERVIGCITRERLVMLPLVNVSVEVADEHYINVRLSSYCGQSSIKQPVGAISEIGRAVDTSNKKSPSGKVKLQEDCLKVVVLKVVPTVHGNPYRGSNEATPASTTAIPTEDGVGRDIHELTVEHSRVQPRLDPNPRASTEPAWPRLSLERYAEHKAQLFLRQLLLPAFVFLLAFLLLLLFLLACLFWLAFLLLFLSRRAESRGHLGVTRGLERRWREAPGRSREPGNRYGRRSAVAVGLGRSSTPTTLDSDVRVGSTVRPRPSHATARHVTTAVNASASARRQRKCPSN
ncbi:hypothetical protein HPB49_017527 [Dermacentor silvarum]|uniref:Uncharacterized protein n=1 Tax=Dermacentor silvarum TaxID=543639 RepID=A0ACB8E266_DERSI|nr:hypothetical protein HPB49_017527 [Dermacentor silvarum]